MSKFFFRGQNRWQNIGWKAPTGHASRITTGTIRTRDRAKELFNAMLRFQGNPTRKNLRRVKRAHRHMLTAPPA